MADKKGTGDSPRTDQADDAKKSAAPETAPKTTGQKSKAAAAKSGKTAAETSTSGRGTANAAGASKSRSAAASKAGASKSTAKPAATSEGAAAVKSAPAKDGAAKSAPVKPEAADTETAKAEAAKPAPAKADAATAKASATSSTDTKTASTSVPKTESARSGSSGSASAAPRANEDTKSSGSGFLALFLGGVCAAAIGFGAAYYILPQTGLMPPAGGDADRIDAQAERIDALERQLADLPVAEAPDLSGLEGGQQTLEGNIAALSQQIEDLTARLDGIEAQPAGSGGGASSGQINALRSALEKQGEQLAALTREAEERDNAARAAAREELRRAALTRIRTALDTGSEFASALGDLERSGMSTPDALQDFAESGVPTAQELQDEFAPAARAALAAARQSGADGSEPGIWSFMSDQLGARSLERKEGPGADAVLSRAEDDLRQGKLESALAEIEDLPEPARAELAAWTDAARARMQALAAHDALAAKLN
ncbi:COG4223 family protein [Roseovarius aquimarinus]|uniref:COG4223 family protein n=1 Tax=Roseovarius aquimarinus TaxID=1229156 RepID=A0ABW7IA90_9RHOB